MTDETQQAATEAAQRVVDQVSSYQYSAEIDGMKDETSGTPQVRSAQPAG